MQLRVLYLHWVDMQGNNHLVGELRELLKPNEVIYEIEYYDRCVKYLDSNFEYFDRISGCPYQRSLEFKYVNKYPWFIIERTPSPKRPDLKALLKEAGLEYYDRWKYLIWNHGVCNVDRYFVSEHKNDLEFKHPWLHDVSIRIYNKSIRSSLPPSNVFSIRNE